MNIKKLTSSDNLNNGIDTIDAIKKHLMNLSVWGEDISDDPKLREKYDKSIIAKLEAGKRLSAKEMLYLKQYNPTLYTHAVRIESKRRALEKQLENASSKREVEEIRLYATTTINKNDPVRKYMMAAVWETIDEFKKTDSYQKLPEEESDKINGKKKTENMNESFITYEYNTELYQIAFIESGLDKGFMVSS